MKKEFWPILVGGLIGGVFWYVAQMVAGKANLVFGFEVMIYALFGGVIAAFISVYTLSDLDAADDKNRGKVLANSLIAAVAFPSIISSAVAVREASDAAESKQLEKEVRSESSGTLEDVSSQLNSDASLKDAELAQLGSRVKALKESAESGTLSVGAAKQVDSDLKQLLEPLKERAEQNPNEAKRITEIIGAIGKDKVSNTSKEATEKLAELQESGNARTKEAAAEELQEVAESYVVKEAIQKVAPIAPARRSQSVPSRR